MPFFAKKRQHGQQGLKLNQTRSKNDNCLMINNLIFFVALIINLVCPYVESFMMPSVGPGIVITQQLLRLTTVERQNRYCCPYRFRYELQSGRNDSNRNSDNDTSNSFYVDKGNGSPRKKKKLNDKNMIGNSAQTPMRGKSDNKNNSKTKEIKTDGKKNKNKTKFPKPNKKGKPTSQPQVRRPGPATPEIGTKNKMKESPNNSENILSLLSNPFKAGKRFRQSLDSALTTLKPGLSPEQLSIYYLDDRFLESNSDGNPSASEGAWAFAQRNSLFPTDDDYVPEVLVVGATGAIGRLVVRRMILSGKFRVRVLVRDLYSNTLNMLGTGVTYCQGDLNNMESLEYAVTDVDKIVFCAGPPKADEDDFGNKFQEFARENLVGGHIDLQNHSDISSTIDMEFDFQRISDTIEVRAQLAQQVDDLGMQNVVRAYQNVRHADYGTSQAAKRSLFKFQDREEDFNLFIINSDEDVDDNDIQWDSANGDIIGNIAASSRNISTDMIPIDTDATADYYRYDAYNNEAYSGYNTEEPAYTYRKNTKSTFIKTQVNWMKNKFNHGVFVGKLPVARNGVGSEASIISTRLRSREDPEMGTDLSKGFAGFVCRVCADGRTYEAFIRTSEYEKNGIEFVYKFQTTTKSSQDSNRSSNKFQTIRIPFSKLKPAIRRRIADADERILSMLFSGKDVKQIGFRVHSLDNVLPDSDPNKKRYKWVNFYIAFCYIKVYRSQPEPEFIYLSDARIPPRVKNGMVRHDLRRILSSEEEEVGGMLFNDDEVKRVLENPKNRSGEELYYKYRGEEILKNSGLQYSIIRVPSLNELSSGEFSTVQLEQNNDNLTAVSRAEVAEVCVSALLDPSARNVCFYLTKADPGSKKVGMDAKISSRFGGLSAET